VTPLVIPELSSRVDPDHLVRAPNNTAASQEKGLAPSMKIRVIASLILLASAGVTVQAHPAPSVAMSGATAASVELEKQKAHAAGIANCEAMWDRTTHMTKTEWSRTCRRVQNRLRQLELR
jgi:hypothetical protein